MCMCAYVCMHTCAHTRTRMGTWGNAAGSVTTGLSGGSTKKDLSLSASFLSSLFCAPPSLCGLPIKNYTHATQRTHTCRRAGDRYPARARSLSVRTSGRSGVRCGTSICKSEPSMSVSALACTCMHVCAPACMLMSVSVRVRVHVRVHVLVRVHVRVRPCPCPCPCMHACARAHTCMSKWDPIR